MSSPELTAQFAARPHITVGEMLTLSAERERDKAAFILPDGRCQSFAETNARVNQLVDALRREGFARGDRIAVLALDSHRYIELILACMKMGVAYVPLNYRLMTSEVGTLIERAQPHGFFFDERYADLVAPLREQHPSIRLWITFDGAGSDYERLLATGAQSEPNVICNDEDILALAFTSGTTGLPKGVIQSQRMMKSITQSCAVDYRASADDIRYCAAPTFHISGVCGLYMGIAVGFTSVLMPQFDPVRVLDLMARDELSAAFLVPTMISTILQLDGVAEHDYDRLELITYGASPITPGLLRRALDTFGCDFLQAFGAGTEAGLQAVLTPEDHRRALAGEPKLLGSNGRPSFGVAMRIVDDDMNPLPPGEVGEVATRSDQVMNGYLGMREATEHALRDGWFRAGDMGYLDENGYLYLHGRKKDMIIRGGENIYPHEIEDVLAEHPAVVQSAVVGVPDEHWGETVRAFLTVSTEVTSAELTAHCNASLARYKVPEEFIVIDDMPTNASGKILKRDLRIWKVG
ncbi:MAG: class I adenylate-forming enzyme family protein [Cumulibacter sp.]